MQKPVADLIRRFFRLLVGGVFAVLVIGGIAYADMTYPSFTSTVKGQGRDIILIPGLMSDGRVWQKTSDVLSTEHRVHIINIAGFGRTPTSKTNTINIVKIELADYISKLDKPVLIGHSLGGFLALSLAIDEPYAVGGVITVDGLPFIGPVFTHKPSTQVSDISAQASFMKSHYANLSMERLREEVGQGLEIQATSEDAKNFVLDMSSLSDPKTVGEMLYSLLKTDLRTSLNKIKTRVVMLGASGAMPNEANKDRLENLYTHQFRSLPSAKIHINRSARHFLMLDDLDWLLDQINAFMQAES